MKTPRAPEAQQTTTVEEYRSIGRLAGRGAAWAVVANLTMRFASIAVTALLARLLSKEDFGVFAVALAVYLIVASLAEMGMASAIARAADEPDSIAPTVATLSIATSGLLGTVMAVASTPLAALLGQPGAAGPIRILSLSLLLTGLFAVPGAQLVREFRQDRIFFGTLVGFVVANPLLVVLALNGGGAAAFAWSRVLGQLATGIVLFLSVSRRYRPGWKQESFAPLLRFGLPLAIANLVNWSLLNADYLILGRLVDAAEVGVYMIAFNVANWSTAIMGSVMNSVVVPTFGRLGADRERLGTALVNAARLVALVAFPVGTLSWALSAPLIVTVFGGRWAEAAPVLAVLAWYGILFSFSLLFANVLVALGKTRQLLVVQLAWVALLVPVMVFGLSRYGLAGVAWAHVVTIALVAVPGYMVFSLPPTGLGVRRLLRPLARPLGAAALAGVVAWLAKQVVAGALSELLIGGFVGALVYLLLVAPVAVQMIPSDRLPHWLPVRRRGHSPIASPGEADL